MVEETPEQARQGRRGKPVAVILLASLALGLIALIGLVVWAMSGEDPGQTPGQGDQSRVIQGPAHVG